MEQNGHRIRVKQDEIHRGYHIRLFFACGPIFFFLGQTKNQTICPWAKQMVYGFNECKKVVSVKVNKVTMGRQTRKGCCYRCCSFNLYLPFASQRPA